MRVVYIHQYFRKPANGGPIRSYYLAKSLVDKGVHVELITTHNHQNIRIENIDGINIHFLPINYDNKFSFLKRVSSFIKFMILSYKYVSKLKKPDYIYASSTPLTIGITALLLNKINKIPFYFEVRDLWPEAPIQMGIIKNPLLKSLLYKLEEVIYKNAEKIIALSPGMKDGIENKVKNKNVKLLPNISDCDFFQKEEKSIKNTFYYGIGDKFVVSYVGAIGKVNNLTSLLEAAYECQKEGLDNITFLVAGRGNELNFIKEKSNQLGLKNIKFLGFLNRNDIKKLLNVTDFSFISFADKKILETNSPNKFFDSIAAGKICIVNNKGWIKELIEKHEIGFYYNMNQPQNFVKNIKTYINDKSLLNKAKNDSRKLAENEFSRKHLTNEFTSIFNLNSAQKRPNPSKSKIATRA